MKNITKPVKNEEDNNISSSEMTAHWRSVDPQFSGDSISKKLSSTNGILKAHQFEEKYNYSLVGRKISVRAGWCLEEALHEMVAGAGFEPTTFGL